MKTGSTVTTPATTEKTTHKGEQHDVLKGEWPTSINEADGCLSFPLGLFSSAGRPGQTDRTHTKSAEKDA